MTRWQMQRENTKLWAEHKLNSELKELERRGLYNKGSDLVCLIIQIETSVLLIMVSEKRAPWLNSVSHFCKKEARSTPTINLRFSEEIAFKKKGGKRVSYKRTPCIGQSWTETSDFHYPYCPVTQTKKLNKAFIVTEFGKREMPKFPHMNVSHQGYAYAIHTHIVMHKFFEDETQR